MSANRPQVDQARLAVHDEQCFELCVPTIEGHQYSLLENAKRGLNEFAREHGYATVLLYTRPKAGPDANRGEFACDRFGTYKPSKRKPGTLRRPKTSTKKTDCPMRIDVVRPGGSDVWVIEYRSPVRLQGYQVLCAHNHPPSKEASSHAAHRRSDRTPQIIAEILADAQVGVRPSQSLSRLRTLDASISLRAIDVRNIKRKLELEAIGNRSRTEYLLKTLQDHGDVHAHRVDGDERLSHLFFAKDEILELFKTSPDVILMDCTYKTNKFGMLLLNIVGISGMNTTTHFAHCFMRGETISEYMWTLSALRTCTEERNIQLPGVIFVDRDQALLAALFQVFPTIPVLLCLWHVIKAVETHARHTFQRVVDEVQSERQNRRVMIDSPEHRDAFLSLIRSNTEAEYQERHARLQQLSPTETAYLDKTWLDKWRWKIVRCWTNDVRHFGLQSTSRVEGYHSSLKRWLSTLTGDLLTLHTRLEAWWTLVHVRVQRGVVRRGSQSQGRLGNSTVPTCASAGPQLCT